MGLLCLIMVSSSLCALITEIYLTVIQGGRQADGAIPSLYALRNIMRSPVIKEAQSSGKFTVIFDSGIRTGSDIMKAVALGAQAVCCEHIHIC